MLLKDELGLVLRGMYFPAAEKEQNLSRWFGMADMRCAIVLTRHFVYHLLLLVNFCRTMESRRQNRLHLLTSLPSRYRILIFLISSLISLTLAAL